MRPPLLVGVDGGGTKTVAWLAELREHGSAAILGRGTSGPSNPRDVGHGNARVAIGDALTDAFSDAGREKTPAAVAVLAIAGAAHGLPRDELHQWCVEQRVADACHLVPDAEPLLAAGTPNGWGIALIAGTGSFAYGRDAAGRVATAGGFGYLVGDEGSAYWLGNEALRALIRQLEQATPATALTDAIAKKADTEALRAAIYQHAANRQTVAALAPLVTSLAESGDAVAGEIVARGAKELSQLVLTAARGLGLSDQPFPLALAGGVLTASPLVRDLVAAHIAEAGGRPQPQTLVTEPVAGCVRLAENFARRGTIAGTP